MVNKSLDFEQIKADNSKKYKGVRKRKWGKWVSEIRLPNSRERIWLGSYDSAEKAARAFDAAQFCLRGKFANFNFPENPPEIVGGRSMTPAEIQEAAVRFAKMCSPSEVVVEGGSGGHDLTIREESEEHRTAEDSLSYSPSISDGTTFQIDSFDNSGVEMSFHEQLSLSNSFGSGNYAADFGIFTGYDFTAGEFFTTPQQDNFGCIVEDDTYDATLYQDSYLWNF